MLLRSKGTGLKVQDSRLGIVGLLWDVVVDPFHSVVVDAVVAHGDSLSRIVPVGGTCAQAEDPWHLCSHASVKSFPDIACQIISRHCLCTGELNAIRKRKCFLCSPFYGRAYRWAMLGDIITKRTKRTISGVRLYWELAEPKG